MTMASSSHHRISQYFIQMHRIYTISPLKRAAERAVQIIKQAMKKMDNQLLTTDKKTSSVFAGS